MGWEVQQGNYGLKPSVKQLCKWTYKSLLCWLDCFLHVWKLHRFVPYLVVQRNNIFIVKGALKNSRWRQWACSDEMRSNGTKGWKEKQDKQRNNWTTWTFLPSPKQSSIRWPPWPTHLRPERHGARQRSSSGWHMRSADQLAEQMFNNHLFYCFILSYNLSVSHLSTKALLVFRHHLRGHESRGPCCAGQQCVRAFKLIANTKVSNL